MSTYSLSESLDGVVIRPLSMHSDERGWLSEIFRSDELEHHASMCYVSWTKSGKARGPHEHVLQTDCFAFVGPGMFRVYLWDNRGNSRSRLQRMRLDVGQDSPTVLLVPPGVVHAYKCISSQDGMVINLPNKLYRGIQRRQEVDEIRHEDRSDSPFLLD